MKRSTCPRLAIAAVAIAAPLSCARGVRPINSKRSPLSLAADSAMIAIPGGPFTMGSTQDERSRAYEDYLASSGKDSARKGHWFALEPAQHLSSLPGFFLDAAPVTQGAFAEFVESTDAAVPFIGAPQWHAQGFVQNYDTEVARFNWIGGQPPVGRRRHPVVLVPWKAARAYCLWRGRLVGKPRRLPTAAQFEKAARGPKGSPYPWGDRFEPSRLNSAVRGPRDTVETQSFPSGISALGVSGMAGNVFQWTSTPWPKGTGKMTVKGSAWDDYGGLGRAASAHGRRSTVSHVIVGFRCAGPGLAGPS